MFAISSNAVQLRDRLEFWRDLMNRQMAPMRTEPIGGHPFHAEMRVHPIGKGPPAAIINVNIGGSRSSRTRFEIAHTRDPFYALCVSLDGSTVLERGDEQVALKPGDVFIVDTVHEFALRVQQPVRHLVLRLPPPWIESRVLRPDGLCGTVLRGDYPLSRLFASYMRSGFETAEELTPDAAALFATHSVELLALALGQRPSDGRLPSQALREALFVRARRLISLRFGESDLNPNRIAGALGISTRLLHRLFAEHDTTVMARVWEERVSRAAKQLAAPDAAHRSITEIAFACGFNDSAHFTRAFVARMDTTPSHWRRESHEHALDGDTAAVVNGGRTQFVPKPGRSVQSR
jgi:AraC family transcriptional regulator, positive regulator of tynA and feaB